MSKSVTIKANESEIVIDGEGLHSKKPGEKTHTMIQSTILSKKDLIEQIGDADWKCAEQRQRVNTAEELVEDTLAKMPEYREVERLKDEMDRAKEKLRLASMSNADLNNAKERMAEEKHELKTRRSILSSLLLHYTADYRLRNVEVDRDNRAIILTGKLGGKLKPEQEILL